jgi:GxxExxY protein
LRSKRKKDFIVCEDFTVEMKSIKEINNDRLAKTLNYMKLADTPIGRIANLQNKSLVHKRLINT